MPTAIRPLADSFADYPSPFLRAIASQAASLIVAVLVGALWFWLCGAAIPTTVWVVLLSLGAATVAAILGLAWWWVILNMAFAPALAIGVVTALPAHWSAAALTALVLVYGGTQRTRVPLYPSNSSALEALRGLIPKNRPASFLDLGAGTGSVLAAIASSHANVAIQGVERAPLPFLFALLRGTRRRAHYRVRWENLWSTDLSGHDIVYAYLSPAPMSALWEKARREMRPGSLLVSFRFIIPGVAPTQTIRAGGSYLYAWRLP